MRNSRRALTILAGGLFKGRRIGAQFGQQRVIIGEDDISLKAVAGVEPDAGTLGGAVGHDLAGVRKEVVRRVFGRDAALDGGPLDADVRLAGQLDVRE